VLLHVPDEDLVAIRMHHVGGVHRLRWMVETTSGKSDASSVRMDASAEETGRYADANVCSETPPACSADFDSHATCQESSVPCAKMVCTPCSNKAYDFAPVAYECEAGKWNEEFCTAGDCGNGGEGPGSAGTYADPKCQTVWLADGGIGSAPDSE
jgi:hypothetical protein